jgi:hypothetical protein
MHHKPVMMQEARQVVRESEPDWHGTRGTRSTIAQGRQCAPQFEKWNVVVEVKSSVRSGMPFKTEDQKSISGFRSSDMGDSTSSTRFSTEFCAESIRLKRK